MATNSFVQVPPDSTGKKLHALQHTVGANTVQGQAMHLADADNPEHFLAVDIKGAASVRFSEGQPTLSGFGSLNVSQKRALGVYESSAGSYDDLFSIEITGSGTNAYDDIGHGMLLTVDGLTSTRVCRTTNRYHYYLPGSSNQMISTIACGDTGKAGNQRRWGAFDNEDGVFWELDGTTLYAVIRSSTTGAVVNTRVAQASWSGDKADGSGSSMFTIDVTKINLYWIDYQWLGAGRVRFGVYTPDGARVVCHTFENAGQSPLPYMRTGTLPLRTENVNSGATGSASVLRESCMGIYTEGTYEDYTFWRSADVNATAVVVGASDTLLVGLRSTTTVPGLNHHNSIVAYPETLNIYTDQPVRIDLTQDVTLTGGTWTATSGETSLEGTNVGTLGGLGNPMKTWFFGAGSHTVCLNEFFEVNDEGIALNADGTQQLWAFSSKKLGATNAAVTLNMGYKELW